MNGAPSAASAPPATKPPVALAAPQKPAVPPVQAAPAKLPTSTPLSQPAPGGSGYRLQLGALKSEEAARAEWERLKKQQADILGKLAFSTSRVDLGSGKGIYYRIQAGPIADATQATQNCAVLKSRNVGCILVKP
jgi:cell division septation protein DedD